LEGDHPTVDDRQASGNAAYLDMFAVVTAEAGAASKPKDEAAAAHREMASLGLEGTCDVIAVIPRIGIPRFVHIRLSMTGAAKGFRDLPSRHVEYGRPRTWGGRGTRWDRVRLNRLAGSIPVVPALALAGPRGTRHRAIS